MIVEFAATARSEIASAVEFYNRAKPGLGDEFTAELKETVSLIQAFPQAWPHLTVSVRRALMNRFPYGILYSPEPDRLLIVAVTHLSRKPDSWQRRQ